MVKQKGAAKQVKEKAKEKTLDETAKEGFAQGYERGFNAGVESKINKEDIRRIAFDDGVRHIVTLAEDFLAKELGLPSREALAKSAKIPAWWIATLVTDFTESPKKPKSFEGEKEI